MAALLAAVGGPAPAVATVTGMSGIGKAALAREVSGRLAHRLHPVWMVVEGSTSAREVLAAVSSSLGRPDRGAGSVPTVLAEGGVLLVLVVHGSEGSTKAALTDVLATCSGIRALVCAISPLGLEGERVLRLGALPVPDLGDAPHLGTSLASMRLMIERIEAENLALELDPTRLHHLAATARAMGGWPLGLHVAASWPHLATRRTAPGSWLDRSARLDDLDGGGHGDLRTLRGALDCTYAHLDEQARRLARSTAVFEGHFTREAVMDASGLARDDAADALDRLIGLGLVRQPCGHGVNRLLVAPVLAEHLRVKLVWARQEGRTRRRLADHLMALARSAAAAADDARDESVNPDLGVTAADVIAALGRRAVGRDPERALQFAADLVRPVLASLQPVEPLTGHLDSLLRDNRSGTPAAAAALAGFGELVQCSRGPDPAGARTLVVRRCEHAVQLARELDLPLLRLRALAALALSGGRSAQADRRDSDARSGRLLAIDLGHDRWTGRFEVILAVLALRDDDLGSALHWATTAMVHARRTEDVKAQVQAGLVLAGLPPHVQVPGGRPGWRTLARLAASFGDRRLEAAALVAGSTESMRRGDWAEAARLCAERLRLAEELDSWMLAGATLLNLSALAAARGDVRAAARLHGSALHRALDLRAALPAEDADCHDALIAALCSKVGQQSFDAGVRDGASMLWGETVAFALAYAAEVIDSGETITGSDAAAALLSPRELQILGLLVRGLTNKAIASMLGLTVKSVMHHTSSVYRKLNVHGRTEAVAWAVRHQVAGPEGADRD